LKVRYRFAAALVAAFMGAASAGSTVYASAGNHPGGGNSTARHDSSPKGQDKTWSGKNWDNRSDNQRDFRQDRHDDRSNFRDHCCDHNNDNHSDNHNSDSSRSSDCDWLRNHDHEAWLRECSH
jgi:hypothetical protein